MLKPEFHCVFACVCVCVCKCVCLCGPEYVRLAAPGLTNYKVLCKTPEHRTVEPSWRTIMPPAFTGWPPYTLTPLDFELESRPFLVEPAPFLWAFSTTSIRLLAGAWVQGVAKQIAFSLVASPTELRTGPLEAGTID